MPTMQDFTIASTVVRFNRNNRMIFAYQSRPRDMAQYPGVLVLHDVEGLTDADRHATRVLAAADYLATGVDLYSRAETPKADKIKDLADRSKFFAKVPDERVLDDLDRAWEVFARLHWVAGQKLGILGFGMGAYYALLFAGRCPGVLACAAVSPRFVLEQAPPKGKDATDLKPVKFETPGTLVNARTDALVVLAGADPELPADKAAGLLDLCDRQSFTTQVVRYDAARPRFWDVQAEGHDAALADAMWQEVLGYFERKLR